MTPSLLAQPPLFLLGVACLVAALRPLLARHARGSRRRWRFALLGTAGAPIAAACIARLGLESYDTITDFLDDPDFRLHLISSALSTISLMAAAALLWIALTFDPSRARPRCPRCWYDMSGATTPTCPECGRAVTSPRALLRTRRSRRLGLLAVVPLIASYAVLKLRSVDDYGWPAFLPNTPMILALPYLPEPALSDADWSLWIRNQYDENLWPWQDWLANRRARLVFAWSNDLVALEKASWFIDSDTPVVLRDRALVRYCQMLTAPELAADPSMIGDLPDLSDYLPNSPPAPQIQHELTAAIQGALQCPEARLARNALEFIPLVPLHAPVIGELVNGWVDRVDHDEPRRRTWWLMPLALLADTDAATWERYRQRLASDDDEIRAGAIRIAGFVRTRRDALIPIAELALADPSDQVALSAAKALRNMRQTLDGYTDSLLAMAHARTAIGPDLLSLLVYDGRRGEPILDLARECLRQQDSEEQLRTTLWAIESLGPDAAPLLPDLDAFAQRPEAQLVAQELDDARTAITTPAEPPDTQDAP